MNVLPTELPVLDAKLQSVGVLRRMPERGYAEADFEQLIASHTGAIASALKSAGVLHEGCQLRVIAQQNKVSNIDVLLAEIEENEDEDDADAEIRRLVLIETKLFRNPEQHRTVLAQILDYANRLQFDVSVDDIVSKADAPTQAWLLSQRHQLERIKSRGSFLLVIAGDHIQPRLLDLAKPMLDRRAHVLSGFELSLLSLALYEGNGTIVLVPNVVGSVTKGERDLCLEVIVRTEGDAPVPATVRHRERDEETARPLQVRTSRKMWTQETFFEDVAKFTELNADYDNPEAGLRSLVDFVEHTPGLDFKWGAGQTATFSIVGNAGGSPIKLAWVDSVGGVSLHRARFAAALGEGPATESVARLGRELGIAIKCEGHTPALTYEFGVNERDPMSKFQKWLLEMRDAVAAAQLDRKRSM